MFYGANPNLANLDGWHPLHLAAYCGPSDSVKFLIRCNSLTVEELYKEIREHHQDVDLEDVPVSFSASPSYAVSGPAPAPASLSQPCD